VVLQPEQGAEGLLRRRWDVLSRSGRPGGFEGQGRGLSPQAHGRADHRAGLEGGQELPKEGCLPVPRRSGKDHPLSPPAPRAGPSGPPSSGPRTYFQATRLTESGTFRVTDFQSSRLCNFRTHVVCQFGGPREASSRQNRLPRRNPGEVQYLYEVLPLPSSKQGGAKASALPIGAWLGACSYLREGSGRISY
jgi:hypothetical protein